MKSQASRNFKYSLCIGLLIIIVLGLIFYFEGNKAVGFTSLLMALLVGVVAVIKIKMTHNVQQLTLIIQAPFQSVERVSNIQVNDRSPYCIVCHWLNTDSNSLCIFYSENLWYDPTPYITQKTFTVRVKPNNLAVYHMDISALPQLAN